MKTLKLKSEKVQKNGTKRNGKIAAKELKRLNKLAQIDAFQTSETVVKPSGFPVAMKRIMAPGIIQVTLPDRRWYFKEINKDEFIAFPSTTWILDAAFPKGKGFNRWLSSMSEEESQKILHDAGERGTRVHAGIEHLLKGGNLKYNEIYQFIDNTAFTPEEWQRLVSFKNFFVKFQPKAISIEQTIINEQYGFAGTADLIAIFDEGLLQTYNPRTGNGFEPNGNQVTAVVDWKNSSAIHDSHKMQVIAYANSVKVDYALIVRLAAKNKNGFEIFISKVNDPDAPKYFETFLHTLELFKFLYAGETPAMSDLIEEINLQ